MTRQRWTDEELADLNLSWAAFSAKHRNRSYDSWEVKRRRVAGGSAGSRLATRGQRVLTQRAIAALSTLAEFVEARS